MKKYLSILFFLFSTFILKAQWREADADGLISGGGGFVHVSYGNKTTIYGSTSDGNFFKSENGDDFLKINIDNYPFNQIRTISVIDEDLVYLTRNGKLRRSINGGAIWDSVVIKNQSDTGFKRGIDGVFFFDKLNGCVFGDTANGCREIWTTKDGGDSWYRVDCSDILLAPYQQHFGYFARIMLFENGNAIYFNKIFNNKIIKISDYGKHWEEINIDEEYQLTYVEFKDTLNGMATRKGNNNIAITTDGGKTWDTTSVGISEKRVSVISYAKATPNKPSFYICGGAKQVGSSDAPVGSYVSFDNGKSWKTLDEFNHHQIKFYDAEIGVSVYYKSDENPFPVRFFEAFPDGFSSVSKTNTNLISIYPNPARDQLNIELKKVFFIEIYTINGVLCDKLMSEKGNLKINIETLNSGTYFLKITEEENTSFHKFIKQ